MAYTKTTWTDGTGQAINATNLNKIETGIKGAHTGSIIKGVYEAEADTNAYTDVEKTAVGTIASLDTRLDTQEAPQTRLQLAPTAGAPAYSEGSINYNTDSKSFELQGSYNDVTLQVGEEMHFHVYNNTGIAIPNGTACRIDGVEVGGTIQIAPALADTFDNARILGVATHEIGVGQHGVVTTFGLVHGLDTTSYPVGVPLYLSATNAGTFTATAPDIITRIGVVFEQDVLNGRLFATVINNKNLPNIHGIMQGQTGGAYSLTGTAQDVVNFASTLKVVVPTNETTGVITTSNTGTYTVNVSALASFVTSTSTRTVTVELYDVANTAIIYSYVKNIPRDATEDSFSFSYPFEAVATNTYKLRIKASDTFDISFTNLSYGITSISLRQ